MKIALFGGSFDPPHNGHNSVVLEALEKLDIDNLLLCLLISILLNKV